MGESVLAQLELALDAADQLYNRLALLVGASGTGKTRLLAEMGLLASAPVLNLNLELSRHLLNLPPRKRGRLLPEILDEIISMPATRRVILDNTEILFDCGLAQDPMRLLLGISRNRTLLASWNGAYNPPRLSYAEPGHPEYRAYDMPDPVIVTVSGFSTLT